jgi:NAD+ synthase
MDIDLAINPEEVSIIINDFIKTYFENSGCKSIIIGLSGGIDSAVTTILCKNAVGNKRIKCIFLPDDTTSDLDFRHLELFINKYNLYVEKKDISPIIKNIVDHCIIKPDKYSLANIKTRIRMILLYEYANMIRGIVCGTSNKSEILTGYFTKYGDGGADIMPIGDLYKIQIFNIAKYLKIPDEMILKAPTAGLIKGQTDEKDLQINYDILDKILYCLERKISIDKIAKILDIKKSEIKRIKKMRIGSQHKRRTPLIPKIGIRTAGLDWRSPLQEG